MTRRRIETVAIVGDGPAGTTLAALLARAGIRVALFSRGRPAGLVVGESLVPAIVPLLRELGVEDEVSSYATLKPGATFVVGPNQRLEICFAEVRGRLPSYAYNVPRDRFDATLRSACEKSGARIVDAPASLERVPGTERVRLAEESLEAADGFFSAAPDLVVDATGRSRLIARLLDLPTRTGDRRDAALFAHCEGVPIDHEGHVHTDRLEHGWCWRIPLPGRVSLGVVADPKVLGSYGATPEEQYDRFLRAEPYLRRVTENSRRVTPVLKYGNYQLATLRGAGDGWALVGDAFGFVDPVFSSGLFLAMDGARALARAIRSGTPGALRRYQRQQLRHIEAWQQVVRYFYDGRFFAIFRMRQEAHDSWIGRLVNPHASKHLPRVFTGESITRRYDRWLLDFMVEHALDAPKLEELRIS
jgi:flavin-dependent dehydrogenase